ncbi:hypothetical protein DENSPDRAFT_906898 [Dentipellis sp. KUC8613]|nr:hypothetical protein DENSPDRAFT_906898 [Dentipellis sp. KUC8613]
MQAYPAPTGGASLLLAFRPKRVVLIIGSNTLAASRAFSALEADSAVTVIARGGLNSACEEIQWRVAQGQISFVDFDSLSPRVSSSSNAPTDRDALAFAAYLDALDSAASLVCITDTVLSGSPGVQRPHSSAEQLYSVCAARSIPTNTTDVPALCDFTFASTHRATAPSSSSLPEKTPLQIAVVTNGQGCRLSARIRREIVAKLPRDAGAAVTKVGRLRRLAKDSETTIATDGEVEWDEEDHASTPNVPVPQRMRHASESAAEATRRRMKWVAQISEYWSYQKLADMGEKEMAQVLSGDEIGAGPSKLVNGLADHAGDSEVGSMHSLSVAAAPTPPGRILLVGSGPGHPGLLTMATHNALTKHADLVLSDKLVPEAVLALIPSNVEVRIARKFPGNADGAQQEMMEAAIEAAKRGLTVVRLKQGDPTVYGRAGEEVLYFRSHGIEPTIVPGVSSALAGPIFAGIPVTQRGAAESFVVCTGVGRQGRQVTLPGYERGRTLVILMGVARLPQVVETLTADVPQGRREGPAYPAHTPIAIIERASMPDQRVTTSTLSHIAAALESGGEQRPPGMIVVGWAVPSLWGAGEVGVLEEGAETGDEGRVTRWLGGEPWRIVEGFDNGWEEL